MTVKKQCFLNPTIIPFVLFACGSFLVFSNFYIASTILPLYIVELGGTEFDIGLQTILFYITSIICRFYFGPLTDRKGRKIPLIIGSFVFSTASLLFWLCKDVTILHLARIYQAIGLAAFFSSAATLAADFAPSGRVGLFMGIYRLLFTVALLSGPAAGLEIISRYDYDRLFILCFATGLLALIFVLFIKPPKVISSGETNFVSTFNKLISCKRLRPIFLGYTSITAGYGIIVTYVVLYVTRFTHYNNPGIYFTYFCIAGIAASLTAGYFSDRTGRQNIAWPSVILLGVGIMVLTPLGTLPNILIMSSVATGVGFSAGVAVFMAWLIDETEEEIKGTVLALQESIFDLSFGLGSFLFGIVTGWIEMDRTFMLTGVIIFVTGCVFYIRNRGVAKDKALISQDYQGR
ncbi:MAG: MFS transporter [Dehalobacterium sp.]|jgi:MFS family permease